MRAMNIKPKNSRTLGGFGTAYSKFYPILYRCILHLAHTPDISCFYRMRKVYLPSGTDYSYLSILRHLESLVMRAIFFRLLCHQSYIGDRTHGRRIEGAMFSAEVNDYLIDARVTTIGEYRQRILSISLGIPHLP